MHRFYIQQCALQSVGRGTLWLISKWMPFESIVVRTIVQITFRLIKLGRSRIVYYIMLLCWSHYQTIPIVLSMSTVNLNKFHETLALISISEILLELVKDRVAVGKFILGLQLLIIATIIRLYDCALPSLLKVIQCVVTPRFIRWLYGGSGRILSRHGLLLVSIWGTAKHTLYLILQQGLLMIHDITVLRCFQRLN